MSDSDTPDSTEYLRLIWGEMKSLNGRINTTNEKIDKLADRLDARIDQTNVRLDQTNEQLKENIRRTDFLIENQIRTTTAIVELQKGMTLLAEGQRENTLAIHQLQLDVRDERDETRALHQRIDHVLTGTVGRKVNDIDERLHRVEQHLGLSGG